VREGATALRKLNVGETRSSLDLLGVVEGSIDCDRIIDVSLRLCESHMQRRTVNG
jgi:hypothetical protein